MAAVQCGCGHIYLAGGIHAQMGFDTKDYCERCKEKDDLAAILKKYLKGKKLEDCFYDVYFYYLGKG